VADVPSFNQSPSYKILLQDVSKCHDVYNGGRDVHKYLNKSTSESLAGFKKSVSTSALSQTFENGINSIKDILFRSPITFDDKISPNLLELYKTVDGRQSFNEFAKEILVQAELSNRVYVLVSTPPHNAKTKAEEIQQGVRPTSELIPRDRVMDKLIKRDGAGNIVRIGITGSYIKTEGKYTDVVEDENRIYFADGTVEIWRDNSDGEMVLHETISSEVKEIHILEFVYNEIKDAPPYINAANYQLQHYNIERSKDRYNIKLGFPKVISWGLMGNSQNVSTQTKDENGNTVNVVEFDADKGIDFSVNPETGAKLGDVKILELDGKADGILETTLASKTKTIVKSFIEVVSDSNGNKTVEQSESERAEGESEISQLSDKMEDFINKIHKLFARFAGDSGDGYITTNKEFIKNGLTELKLKMLDDLLGNEIIDKIAYTKELQGMGELQTLDIDELEKRLIADGKR